jgi:5-oxoprolinase (ATP-hydrolysing) subunit C
MGLLVIDPGFSTTVQDMGRPGYRQWGVPPGGPFDRGSASLANALVGNSPACAVLEFTLQGGVYEADCPLAIALAGASIEATVQSPDSREERRLELPLCCSLAARERLLLGRMSVGARAYLAVKGGWQTPPILGSRSSEERIAARTILPAEPGAVLTRRIGQVAGKSPTAEPFRILPGPDDPGGSSFDRAFWSAREFRVSSHANRVGLRLEGEPVTVAPEPERLSTPVAPQAIQVAGGQLIILGVACGTMGGYPHIAQVISADLDRIGQLRPGDTLQFLPVTLAEARRLDRESRARNKLWRDRLRLLADGEIP